MMMEESISHSHEGILFSTINNATHDLREYSILGDSPRPDAANFKSWWPVNYSFDSSSSPACTAGVYIRHLPSCYYIADNLFYFSVS